MPVIIVGTLDTKGDEVAFVRELLRALEVEALVIDAGVLGPPAFTADITREEVFRRAGTSIDAVRARGDRGEAVSLGARGAAAVVADLAARGQVAGILGLGGSAGTVLGTTAMRALPFGVPKVMVSTLASGQTRPYVGGSDIMMVSPVADVAGLNRLTRTALTNAALALAGMVRLRPAAAAAQPEDAAARPLVGATMFGVTTPCVDRARRALELEGIEVLVFHATGVGGQAMEGLVRDGQIAGLLDLTTTELADELVGVLSAGPDRLEAAVRAGTPQVVSLGALDMVNFGPMETVPEKFKGRLLHAHNPSVTLMRTTVVENAMLGSWIARVIGGATAPAVVMVPLRGVSALSAPGKLFHDPNADHALFESLREGLSGHPFVRIETRDENINDPEFADAAVRNLLGLMGRSSNR